MPCFTNNQPPLTSNSINNNDDELQPLLISQNPPNWKPNLYETMAVLH
ncbi:hypothetical protein [Spiroplasma endosymbiont of Nebria brevicollis]